ncbi:MAG: coniferyl-alcohol dehydrogenase [Sphingopyxis sp.]|nr:coniferyl-alcohol dehydrogenase [Sphingopyxis sp.]
MHGLHCHGRNFVVTGVSSGIGAALARALVNAGGHVIGIDRHRPDETMFDFLPCDLADPQQIVAAVARITVPIHGLVNVAGVPGSAPLERIAQVNFLAVRALTSLLLPRIVDGGAVVNVASAAGINWRLRLEASKTILARADWDDALQAILDLGHEGPEAYDFSKELVILYSALAASAHFHRGVRVNSVSPGAVSTPILRDFYATMGSEMLDRIKRQAGGRDADPVDIVGPVCFLLGEAASWVNGTDLLVDGGGEVTMTFEAMACTPTASGTRR